MGRLIGVTGYAQAGKDTTADYLVANYGYTKLAFAGLLKDLALVLNPCIPWETDRKTEARPVGYHPVVNTPLADLVERLGWESAKQHGEVRRFLQVLGTEGVRDHLGEDAWVDALLMQWGDLGCPDAVISDVRFPNEAQAVLDQDGVMVRVWRTNEDGSPFDNGVGRDHPSEQWAPSLPVHFDVTADSVGVLTGVIDSVMQDLEEGFIPKLTGAAV